MTYWQNKYWSLGLTVGVAMAVLLLAPSEVGAWVTLYYVALIFGYTHFLVGGFYQWRSYVRQGNHRALALFSLLVLLSISTGVVSAMVGAYLFFNLLVLTAFVVHGALNEKTLYEEGVGVSLPPWSFHLLFTAALLIPLYASLLHPSRYLALLPDGTATLFFTAAADIETFFAETLFAPIFLGYLCVALLLVYAAAALLGRYASTTKFVLLGGGAFGALLVYLSYPLPFMLVLYALLVYHFTTWFIVSYDKIRVRGDTARREYLWLHALIAGGLTLIVLTMPQEPGTLGAGIFGTAFNLEVYLTVTLAHLLTTFLNEPVCKRYLQQWNTSVQ